MNQTNNTNPTRCDKILNQSMKVTFIYMLLQVRNKTLVPVQRVKTYLWWKTYWPLPSADTGDSWQKCLFIETIIHLSES